MSLARLRCVDFSMCAAAPPRFVTRSFCGSDFKSTHTHTRALTFGFDMENISIKSKLKWIYKMDIRIAQLRVNSYPCRNHPHTAPNIFFWQKKKFTWLCMSSNCVCDAYNNVCATEWGIISALPPRRRILTFILYLCEGVVGWRVRSLWTNTHHG